MIRKGDKIKVLDAANRELIGCTGTVEEVSSVGSWLTARFEGGQTGRLDIDRAFFAWRNVEKVEGE